MTDVIPVTVRQHKEADIKVLFDMTREAGWDFTEFDCMSCLKVDPEGLLVAEDASGNPVGFLGVWDMSATAWFGSIYIVRKEVRQQGLGYQLWSSMLKRTGHRPSKNGVMECVVELRDWYSQQGFIYQAFQVHYFKGVFDTVDMTTGDSSVCTVTPLSHELWPALLDYDREIYPYCRERVLRAWFRGQESHTVVALSNGNVVGYGNFHTENDTDYHIRALHGDNDAIADAIISSLFENVPTGSPIQFQLVSDKTLPRMFSRLKPSGSYFRISTHACPTKYSKIYMNSPIML